MGLFKSKAEKELDTIGILKPESMKKYETILSEYQSKLKGYTHKDQKPYWT